jgi:hypothetical protein
MKEGNPNRRERRTTVKHLDKTERKKVASKAAKNRRSNELYVKHAQAALDAWETIREDRRAAA